MATRIMQETESESDRDVVTQDMIDNVLAVCPDVYTVDVRRDLQFTSSVSTTINRILDGEFISGSVQQHTNPTERTTVSSAVIRSTETTTSAPASTTKRVYDLSDTDIDSDTDDSDIVLLKEERQQVFANLRERLCDKNKNKTGETLCANKDEHFEMGRTQEWRDTDQRERSKQGREKPWQKSYKRTSEIIDVTLSDDESSSVIAMDVEYQRAGSSEEVIDIDNDCASDSMFSSNWPKTEAMRNSDHGSDTCEVRKPDLSPSDSDSDNLLPVISTQRKNSPKFSEQIQLSSQRGGSNELSQASYVGNASSIPRKRKKCSSEEMSQKKQEAMLRKEDIKEKEKAAKRETKEKERQAKQQTITEKRLEKEKEKLSKKAQSLNQKSQRKDECLKQINACLDPSLLTCGAEKQVEDDPVLVRLTNLGVSYSIVTHPIPECITWKRVLIQHSVSEELQIRSEKNVLEEKLVLVRVDAERFVGMVDVFKKSRRVTASCPSSNTLVSFCCSVAATYHEKSVTLVVIGLEKYFRDIKSKHARQLRNAVRGDAEPEKPKGKSRNGSSAVVVTRVDVEEALVDLELRVGCSVCMLETAQEFADLVGMMTKAVAEAPHKRNQPEAFSFCVESWSKPSVKVTKEGEGLLKVWQQQIQQYPNVSANMAAAIVAAYSSPQELINAYKRCSSESEASRLLQDIQVRRGAGVLATSRRIGPELSRRIHLLFTSTDGQMSTK